MKILRIRSFSIIIHFSKIIFPYKLGKFEIEIKKGWKKKIELNMNDFLKSDYLISNPWRLCQGSFI